MTNIAIRRGYADSRDGQVHYRRVEGAGRPVVFLHQTASSGAMFEMVMQRLGDDHPSIAFDTPGFGNSFRPEGEFTLPYLAARLVEALDDMGVGEFDLIGHHTGGCIALEMTAQVPDRITSFGLMGPLIATAAERDSFRSTFTTPFRMEADGSHLGQAWEYLKIIGAHTRTDLHHREVLDHLLAWDSIPKAFSAVWDQDSEKLLAGIKVPILLMISEDDVLYRIFHNATRARPDALVSIVKGFDFQPDNDPDGVATGVRDFLKRGLAV